MILEVDTGSPVPPYEQIREQIATMVATGVLADGTQLPPIRQLASDLGIAGGTVARAYRELEAAGLARGRGRHGTVIRRPAPPPGEELDRQVDEAARVYAVRVRQLGVGADAAMDALRRAFDVVPAAS